MSKLARVDEAPLTPRVKQPEELMANPEPEPWERQPDEGEREWTAFKFYRDMPTPRNYQKNPYIGGMRVSTSELSRWYREWCWAERAAAYDILTDRVMEEHRRKILETNVEEATAQQLATLTKLDEVLLLEAEKLLEAARSGNGPGLIRASDFNKLLENAVKLRRLLTNQTTDNVGVGIGAVGDLPVDDPEELMAWRKRLKEGREAQGAKKNAG